MDIAAWAHHDALMRTTIDLPEDLHQIALALARDTGRSLSQAVALLMRRGLAEHPRVAESAAAYVIDAATGLPRVQSSRPVTSEDVRATEDEG